MAGPTDGPSEEELRAYLGQLRQAPVTDLIAQAVAMLVNAAQVKLGLDDGRTLIDVTAAVAEAAGDRLDPEFRGELDGVLNQLRLAQVEAEGQLAGAGGPGDEAPAEAPPPPPKPAAAPPPASSSDPGSRLWVPPGSS